MSAVDLDAWLDAFLRDPAFLDRYPYYAAILAAMRPVADPSVQRMAVSLFDGQFFLHVNVDAFVREPQYLRGVLLHEVHHVVLGHLSHPKFTGASEPELMDLALEMSANEYIEEPLPQPIVHRAYAAIGIRAGQSTLDRYDKLLEASRAGATRARATDRGREDESRRVDDHRLLRRGDRDPGALEHTRRLLQRSIDDVRTRRPEGDDADPGATLLCGKDPGRLIEELTGASGQVEHFLDWKTAIRMFVARARGPVHTFSRPSRRFPAEVGVIPGRTYAPRVLVRPFILVAIDTSMSMSSKELAEVGRQLAALAEHARIHIVECDTEITRKYPFTGVLTDVAGRGGTDLRPVFDRALLASTGAQGIVYFTDGDGPLPEHSPSIPVLWVLTKPEAFDCPWGTIARMTRPKDARGSTTKAAQKQGARAAPKRP